ncbi:MAG TPA: protein translocase subunit SecD [candidate division Zixibacteria bacterium]|jgi:protein-export membrane protein SecD
MARGQGWKIGLILVVTLGSLWFLWPTIRLWQMSPEDRDAFAQTDPKGWQQLQKKAMKLGLDLRGGMRVVLEVDKSELNPDEAKDAVERAKEILRNRVDEFGVTEPLIQIQGEDRIVVELAGITDVHRAEELIGRTAQLEFRLLESPEQAQLLLDRIDRTLEAVAGLDTTRRALPSDTGTGTDVLDELFGSDTGSTQARDTAETVPDPVSDSPQLATDAAGGRLPPQVPSERPLSSLLSPSAAGPGWIVESDDVPLVKVLLAREDVKRLIPADVEFAWGTRPEFVGSLETERLYLAKRQAEMTGNYLTDARPSFDQFRKPIVNFELTRDGGRMFGRLTGANIGKPLAIVLDGRVESAPEIQSRIRDRGQITLGGGTYDDANDLAIVLRAGALPAPVSIVESSVVGPSLGSDSIRRGVLSSLIGGASVVVIMLVYYQLSGLIANFGMMLNGLFLLGVMAILHATLTMPGIAGIILTLGMSVDANILIFERIREELRAGKTVRHAIDAGYSHALVAIVDSHVTTLITALALFLFGTGPVKGFAVTLFWGVLINLFTAVFVTRAVFDVRKGYAKLSI